MIYTIYNPKLVNDIHDFKFMFTNFTGVVKDNINDIFHFLNGKLHREDGPAYEKASGETKRWYINGKLHREDGPAIEDKYCKEWYLNDICYGWNDAFTNESWTRFVKLELLK